LAHHHKGAEILLKPETQFHYLGFSAACLKCLKINLNVGRGWYFLLLAIIYNNFGPYHLARLAATARLGEARGLQVMGLELASQEKLYPWKVDKVSGHGRKYTLFPRQAIEEVRPLALTRATWSALSKLQPQAVAMGLSKETFPALLTALAWTRHRRGVAICMMDSKYDDFPRHPWKEWLKKRVFHGFDAALVGGVYSRRYAQFLGIPPENIFVGCDVVDNEFFAREALRARENAGSLRATHQLPENFFLFVGRLDEKKNVSRLLAAYEHYLRLAGELDWGLVICGSGPLEESLRLEARQLGLAQVIFTGFQQLEKLPIYYGLARCLVTPSSHNEQWGLVVNEAMASGLPVLVSEACGCATDLVEDRVNGYIFNPYDVAELAGLMREISSGRIDLQAMGEASRQIISHWSLDTYAQNVLRAVAAGMTHRSRAL
jgi:1,2-diacylglycerol 3-alpha-glucosyltransferase